MFSFEDLQERFSREIDNHFLSINREPKELYEPVRYILSIGGKRLRPVLLLMSTNLFSEKIDNAIPAAIAFEIFHNFTLLHDDIMDNSSMRRNKPTVHIKWDKNTAILSGDAMSIIAYDFLTQTNTEHLKAVFELFNQTALQVCEGQQYDLNFESENTVSVEQYLEMIELKTSVLLAACLKTGAILGGASVCDANMMYDIGKNIGLAFQLQDDYLDVYGNTKIFGKKIGNDIAANKKTYLLIKALELAKGDKKTKLAYWLQEKKFDFEEKRKKVTSIYNALGVKEHSKKLMNYYNENAFSKIERLNVPAERKQELIKLTKKLLERAN